MSFVTVKVVELFIAWLVGKYNFAPTTITTYLAGLKRAIGDGIIKGSPNVTSGVVIHDILKGVARSYVKPPEKTTGGAPFTMGHFHHLRTLYGNVTRNEQHQSYDDLLVFAIMGAGLGGCLRPGEYLTTGVLQADKAILTFDDVSIRYRWRNVPTARLLRISSLDFMSSRRRHYERGEMKVDCIQLRIKHSKTDQTGIGITVTISDEWCVYDIMDYLLYCEGAQSKDTPFFLHEDSRAVHTGYATKIIHDVLRRCSFVVEDEFDSPDDFTLRCLRSGAAQTLADKGGSDVEIMRLGRWRQFNTALTHYFDKLRNSGPLPLGPLLSSSSSLS